jgi:hypothetical protein
MQKLLAVALLGFVCAGPAGAAVAAPATVQILQQRTADGSLLLTDRPAPGAKTERSWQVQREDPAAARQRAIDVKAEANLVSERVQRMLDRQRRDDDAQRMRLESLQLDGDRAAAYDQQDGITYGIGLFGSNRLHSPRRFRSSHGDDHRGMRSFPGQHGRQFIGSGAPGSR